MWQQDEAFPHWGQTLLVSSQRLAPVLWVVQLCSGLRGDPRNRRVSPGSSGEELQCSRWRGRVQAMKLLMEEEAMIQWDPARKDARQWKWLSLRQGAAVLCVHQHRKPKA